MRVAVSVARLVALALLTSVAQAAEPASDLRVVSANGAITETIYALGGEEALVAVDTTSVYPPAARRLPKVGYLRALPFEGVLSLQPDRLITTVEAQPKQTLERLAAAGVEVEQLPLARSPEATMARVTRVGELIGKQAEAAALVAEMADDFAALAKDVEARGWRPRVLLIMSAGNHGVVFGGADTGADAFIQSLGADNAVATVTGYKPASREAIISASPDAIIIAEATPGQFRIEDWPELAQLPAWINGHHYTGDSMFLLGYGPRLADALAEVNEILPSQPVSGHDD